MRFFDFLTNQNATRQPDERGSYINVAISDGDLKILINNAISVFETNQGADQPINSFSQY